MHLLTQGPRQLTYVALALPITNRVARGQHDDLVDPGYPPPCGRVFTGRASRQGRPLAFSAAIRLSSTNLGQDRPRQHATVCGMPAGVRRGTRLGSSTPTPQWSSTPHTTLTSLSTNQNPPQDLDPDYTAYPPRPHQGPPSSPILGVRANGPPSSTELQTQLKRVRFITDMRSRMVASHISVHRVRQTAGSRSAEYVGVPR